MAAAIGDACGYLLSSLTAPSSITRSMVEHQSTSAFAPCYDVDAHAGTGLFPGQV
jgi:hypothetical protein